MNKSLRVILAIMLISVLLIAGCSEESETPEESNQESEASEAENQAPDFQLNTLDGQTITLSDFRGKVVMLNFWAYWCGPCASEMSFIQQIYDEWQEAGLVLLTIHVGESAEEAASFVEAYDLTFPVLLDIEGTVMAQYGVSSIPTTFLIDEDGIAQAVQVGAFSSVAEIESGLSRFLTK